MRRKLFRFIARRVFKIPEGNRFPWHVLVIKAVLFPLRSYCAKQNGINYDPATDVYTIEGMKYTGELFCSFADGGMKTGQLFRIIRASNGYFAIEEINEKKGEL